MIFLEAYIDFLITIGLFLCNSGLGLLAMNKTMIFVIALVVVFIIPGSLLWVANQSQDRLREDEFKERWQALYQDIRLGNLTQRLFYFVFIGRRASLVASAFWLIDYPGIQIIVLNLTNLAVLIYQG